MSLTRCVELGALRTVPAARVAMASDRAAVRAGDDAAPDPLVRDVKRIAKPANSRKQPSQTSITPGSRATLRPVNLASRSNVNVRSLDRRGDALVDRPLDATCVPVSAV